MTRPPSLRVKNSNSFLKELIFSKSLNIFQKFQIFDPQVKNSNFYQKVDFCKNWNILNIFQKFLIFDPRTPPPAGKKFKFASKSWFLKKLEHFEHFSKNFNFWPATPPPAGGRGPRVKKYFQNIPRTLHTKFQEDIFKIDKVIQLFPTLEKKKEEKKEEKKDSLWRGFAS